MDRVVTGVAVERREGLPGRRVLDDVGRVNRLYAVLSQVNEAIIRIREPQELYEAACRIAVEEGGFLLAWIGFVEPGSKVIRPAARFGLDEGYLDALRLSLDETVAEGRGPTGVALREGRPFINNDTENNPIMRPWRTEQLKRGFRSSASFPLKSEDAIIGVITLYAGVANYFDSEEVRLLATLADDFSFALETSAKARRYDVEHRIADVLQAALITLPDSIDRIEYASSYSSASESTRVGGDFYDLFDLGHGPVGITIGDISGKGLDAAVLTSLVRTTIRAYACDGRSSPSDVLERTNALVHASTAQESFATGFFAMLDRESGRLAYANAGHPAAMLLRQDASVELLPATGPILGAFEPAGYDEAETRMGPDDLLFLYTDGLTEARRGADFYGERRLVANLSDLSGKTPPAVIDAVLRDVASFTNAGLRDDLAILALKRAG